jgi:hypothetical protein
MYSPRPVNADVRRLQTGYRQDFEMMKLILRFLILASFVAGLALQHGLIVYGQCGEHSNNLYARFRDNFRGNTEQQKVAYEVAQEYLSKYGSCPEADNQQVAKYIENWVGKYEQATVEFKCRKAAKENPTQAFEVCAPWIATNPDDLRPRLALVAAGISAYQANDNSLNARAAEQGRTALQLIDSGKTTETWAPFANQQDAPAGLRYFLAAWSLKSEPDDSATQLLKVAQSNSTFAKEPTTFQLLGDSYYHGELKRLASEYKAKCEGREITPECDALLNKINNAFDRVIDAYARAVALSNANPSKYGATPAALRPVLTTFYKQRHDNSEAGLNELIATVVNKPLPMSTPK